MSGMMRDPFVVNGGGSMARGELFFPVELHAGFRWLAVVITLPLVCSGLRASVRASGVESVIDGIA